MKTFKWNRTELLVKSASEIILPFPKLALDRDIISTVIYVCYRLGLTTSIFIYFF